VSRSMLRVMIWSPDEQIHLLKLHVCKAPAPLVVYVHARLYKHIFIYVCMYTHGLDVCNGTVLSAGWGPSFYIYPAHSQSLLLAFFVPCAITPRDLHHISTHTPLCGDSAPEIDPGLHFKTLFDSQCIFTGQLHRLFI